MKNFIFDLIKGLALTNRDEVDKFVIDKSIFFEKKENFSSVDNHLELMSEICNMCDTDIKTATIEVIGISEAAELLNDKKKADMILAYDLIEVLGHIYFNIFDKFEFKFSCETTSPYSISAMIKEGQTLLAQSKRISMQTIRATPSYGATLIFMTLLERQLKLRVKTACAKHFISELKKNVDAGVIRLMDEEANVFACLLKEFLNMPLTCHVLDGKEAASTKLYLLLIKYSVIRKPSKKHDSWYFLKKLLRDEITLVQLINTTWFSGTIKEPYVCVCKKLFDELDLRNNLAHCNFAYLNYYNVYAAPLLFVMYYLASDDNIDKEFVPPDFN